MAAEKSISPKVTEMLEKSHIPTVLITQQYYETSKGIGLNSEH